MSLAGKLVSELEVNGAAEKYYKVFKDQTSRIPTILPKIFQQVKLYEGDWDNYGTGSIVIWNYTIDGKAEVFKERTEFDDEKFTMIMNGLEGDVFNYYKVFKATFHIIPKGPEHGLTILTLEYEKLDDGSPYPYKYLNIMNDMVKAMESYFK